MDNTIDSFKEKRTSLPGIDCVTVTVTVVAVGCYPSPDQLGLRQLE